ncbi:hypothetical protein JCM19039_4341 [Geomicrobium sp. JCM 19039]|nr:hypothetical protein JCM19039_4341 [Geomicrobium sp. JCM 19039]
MVSFILFFTKREYFKRTMIASVGSFGAMVLSFVMMGVLLPNDSSEDVARADEEPAEEEEVNEVEESVSEVHSVELDASINFGSTEDEIHISGDTSFEDGVTLTYTISNLDHMDEFIEGDIEVQDGEFATRVDISSFQDGEVHVVLGYYPFAQTEDITEKYGFEGEYIGHDHIDEFGEIRFEETFVRSHPVELSGSGDTATDSFSLNAGFAVINATHQGSSNFALYLKDEYGGQDLLVNEIGNYDGETFAVIPQTDDFYLEVKADGSWEASVTQTIPEEVTNEDDSIEGTGDSVVFVDMSSGNKRLSFTHSGDSNFVVRLNGQNLLVNEIGHYEGNQTFMFNDDDVYAFEVLADGKWRIDID